MALSFVIAPMRASSAAACDSSASTLLTCVDELWHSWPDVTLDEISHRFGTDFTPSRHRQSSTFAIFLAKTNRLSINASLTDRRNLGYPTPSSIVFSFTKRPPEQDACATRTQIIEKFGASPSILQPRKYIHSFQPETASRESLSQDERLKQTHGFSYSSTRSGSTRVAIQFIFEENACAVSITIMALS